ncbi:MAG TPA: hypothetical protein VGR62_04755, partial [Candidatus Binatia bacterium]|nr:hypothetical protein [Candidatus Binatia bacterium]
MRAMPIVLVLLASTVHALQVPQQRGNACAVVWDVGDATAVPGALRRQPWELVCADGDVRCDRDGVVNGRCEVRVAACVATSPTDCTPEALTALRIPKATRTALRGLVPPSLAATNTCGEAGTVVLEASGTRRRDILLSLRSKTASGRGRNRLRVKCVPSSDCVDCPTACDVRACTRDATGLPRLLTLTVGSTGSDLDLGYSGNYHNQQLTAGTRLGLCLDGCNATTDAICDVQPVCDPTAGDVIGPPQPFLSNGVPACLVTRRTPTDATGTIDLASGAMTVPLAVEVDVYVQTSQETVCPRCSGLQFGDRGKCEDGARNGLACTVDGTVFVFGSAGPGFDYNVSSDCIPAAGKLASTVPLSLTLT